MMVLNSSLLTLLPRLLMLILLIMMSMFFAKFKLSMKLEGSPFDLMIQRLPMLLLHLSPLMMWLSTSMLIMSIFVCCSCMWSLSSNSITMMMMMMMMMMIQSKTLLLVFSISNIFWWSTWCRWASLLWLFYCHAGRGTHPGCSRCWSWW